MIQLNLTGANSNNREMHRSIGGVISTFPLQNGNIFSDISKTDLQTGKMETRVIALTNTGEDDIPTLSVYYDIEDDTNISVQVGCQYFDESGNVELLPNDGGIPFNVTYVDALGVGNAVEISTGLLAGQSLSLWFKREVGKIEDNCEVIPLEGKNKVEFYVDC